MKRRQSFHRFLDGVCVALRRVQRVWLTRESRELKRRSQGGKNSLTRESEISPSEIRGEEIGQVRLKDRFFSLVLLFAQLIDQFRFERTDERGGRRTVACFIRRPGVFAHFLNIIRRLNCSVLPEPLRRLRTAEDARTCP